MAWWGGVFLTAAAVLAISGVAKLGSPQATQRALRSSRLPSSRLAVSCLAVAEVALAAAAVATGSWTAATAVAVIYLAYAVFVATARYRGGPETNCGCFGKGETPPTLLHIVINLVFAAAAGLAATQPTGGLPALVARSPGQAGLLAGYAVLGGWLTYLVLDVLPSMRAVR